jgi:hypothetical protein
MAHARDADRAMGKTFAILKLMASQMMQDFALIVDR